jgi:hypothetical protein
MNPLLRLIVVIFAAAAIAVAQAPKSTPKSTPSAPSDQVRPVPPPGIKIPDADRGELQKGVAELGKEIDSLRAALRSKPALLDLLPDVQIYHKAVDWALRYDEFFDVKQVDVAKKQLALGMERAKELRAGKASWNTATGLVPRGYVSKIDGSVQPYGLVIPDEWKPGEKTPRRLDFWCHGRGEKLSELDFINQRLTSKGEFTPPGAIVLHLYGRYCCANKFAGEIDLFEALENARTHYNIDMNRLVVRGFSMGGASTWQFGTHHAGMWAAVQPGAGFAETEEFFHVFAPGKEAPPWFEQKLWRLTDSTIYVANLANTATVAYSGEIDGQKQAADIMIRFARKEADGQPKTEAPTGQQVEGSTVALGDGSPSAALARVAGTATDLVMYHVTAPKTPHKILAEEKPEIEKLVGAAVEKGRDEQARKGHLTTYTLIYPSTGNGLTSVITGMEKEWERADLDWDRRDPKAVRITTRNVTSFTWIPTSAGTVAVDGQPVAIDGLPSNAFFFLFTKTGGQWKGGFVSEANIETGLRKKPGVCGPIDHAFMSSFVFVKPTGKPLNDKVGAWTKSELDHAISFWRKVYRGDASMRDDRALTQADIANSNLVLWGDPSSNAVLARILPKLPLKWTAGGIEFNGKKYSAGNHAPILIFPNPLNPNRYVVLNSGVTFREFALLNNSDQTAKLPDYAIVNLDTPPDAKWPGLIEDAGFFGEHWELLPDGGK